MTTVYLGLGANLGDRAAALAMAVQRLDSPELRLLRLSSLYETEPIGFREQPWFFNQVGQFETELFPAELLRRTKAVEDEMGRTRGLRNGPRTIDIDILFYGAVVGRIDELEIPHPRFRERRFVLAPLAELDPGLRDPQSGRTVGELLAELEGQAVLSLAPAR